MDKEVFKIARQSGLIPKELDKAKSDYVKSLASEFGVDEKKYIEYLHAATKAEIERVKEVAQKYNIPVVLHKGRGAGHGADPAIQFSRVCDLEFYEDRREIVQTSILQKEPVGQDLFCEIRGEGVPVLDWSGLELSAKLGKGEVFLGREEERQVLDYSKSTKGLISDDEDEAKQEVKNAELRLLNNNKDLNESEHEDVISGSALNIVEVNVGDVAKKGVAIYLNNCGSFNSELYQIIESPQLRNARFIILAMAIPESVQDKDEYLQCRYNFYSKLFSDLGIEKPCFITESSVNESKMAPLFSADVNLKDMLLKNGTKKAASRIVKSAISSAFNCCHAACS